MTQATEVIDKVRTNMRGKWGAWMDRLVLAIITYGIWWMVQSVGTLLTQNAVMSSQIGDLRVQTSGLQLASDARKDSEANRRRDDRQDTLLIDLDKRVSNIERRLP